MIGFPKTKKINNQVSKLINNILADLPSEYTYIREEFDKIIILDVLYVPNPNNGTEISLLKKRKTENKEAKQEKRQFIELGGIYMNPLQSGDAVEIILPIWNGQISSICFNQENIDILRYDADSVSLSGLTSKPLQYKNEDLEKLTKILNRVSDKNLNKLEMSDTFEISTDSNTYYTIMDFEDGNYIAIDESKKVYRLSHEHVDPEKLINENINNFLDSYSGNKQELQYLFEYDG